MNWFEDEAFWRELYPYMFAPERLSAADAEVDQILALTKFSGSKVLDLCCGPGRHSAAFASRGFQVTGVDRSRFLLERARERAAEANVNVEWVEDDMRHFSRPAAFDLACCLFTSFGYFEEEDEDLQVLRRVRENLTNDGVFIMDVLGKERLARVFKDAQCTDFPDGTIFLQRPQVLDDWRRIRNEWMLLKDSKYRTFRFEHFIYSGRELSDRLAACGFQDVRLYGDLKGSPYGLEAMRLVAVARKIA